MGEDRGVGLTVLNLGSRGCEAPLRIQEKLWALDLQSGHTCYFACNFRGTMTPRSPFKSEVKNP